MVLGEDGVFRSEQENVGHVHNLLPEVTVPVCSTCNNGWMNELETSVQPILRPFLSEDRPIIAGRDQKAALAVWALNTFMTYALTRGSHTNPFTADDYAQLRRDRSVPPQVRVWMCTAASRWAHVALQLRSWTMAPAGALPHETTDNSAIGLLAVGGAVFILAKTPPELPLLAAVIEPPRPRPATSLIELTRRGIRGLKLPPRQVGEDYMEALDQWMHIPDLSSLPAPDGLTLQQVADLSDMSHDGIPNTALVHLLPSRTVDIAESAGRVAEAEALAEQFRQHGDPVGAALQLTRAGRQQFYAADYQGAAQLMTGAFHEPGGGLEHNPEAAYRIAQCYRRMHDPRCVPWYERSIKLGAPITSARFGLVDGLTWKGDYAAALEEVQRIHATTSYDRGTALAVGLALQFLVDDLQLPHQDRKEPSGEDLAAPTLTTLRVTDATSATLWRQLPANDPDIGYHFPRAWFGNVTDSWIVAAFAVTDLHGEKAAEDYLRFALSCSPELGLNIDGLLAAMDEAGSSAARVRRALRKARRRW